MKKTPYFIIALFLITLLMNSCGKKCNKLISGYQFQVPVTLSPALDTFNIGDTISIVSEFSDMVYEQNTGDYYLLEDFNFYPVFALHNIDSTNIQAIDDFEILTEIPSSFEYLYEVHSFAGEYAYRNDTYTLRFKLVPQKKGLFAFSAGSALYFAAEQDFPKRCKGESLKLNINLNNNEGHNIEFFQYSRDTAAYQDIDFTNLEQEEVPRGGQTYVFFVD